MPRRIASIWFGLSLVCVLCTGRAMALEIAERSIALEVALGADGSVRIENLLGSIQLVANADSGLVQVEARAVAEAETAEEAQALVDAIRLDHDSSDGGSRIHVAWPLDRATSYRPPRAGMKGLLSRWSAPVLRRKATALEYEGRRVEVTAGRKATGLAVHVVVHLPFDARASALQSAGSIHGRSLRGDLHFETVSGDVFAEKIFGTLNVKTEDGDVRVTSFQGEELVVNTTSGDVELLEVRAGDVRLATGDGSIGGVTLTADSLSVESVSGDVDLRDIEPGTIMARTDSGDIELSTRLRKVSDANIYSNSGDVTLRVGELSHFDLLAETRSGSVKTIGLELKVLDKSGTTSKLRHGVGGTVLRVTASSLVVRPYDGSRMDMFLRGPLD